MYRMCQTYQALPDAGGVLDQSVGMLRMHAILVLGGHFGEVTEPGDQPFDFEASIPMELL